ncbi:hypothetical protein WICPIJ_006068 [Wickerhamomyces pijperi]|uniref:Copper-fist domain-containing protein n=1 Tax=Wickerhamomyces pijperi TaxID=599730 RepID=A0A9P8Q2S9_WICPI|nr:hypothetical protein WICPIJ_006068 [Wickerhamomyces pijperi]
MILVDGEKYACVQCIRGHRSSTCKHSHRPLVQVRSRGRPALNQSHRIAVTASELVLPRHQVTFQSDQSTEQEPVKDGKLVTKEKKSCCSKKSEPKPELSVQESTVPASKSCCKSASRLKPVIRSCCNHTSVKTQSNCPSCKSGNSSVILLRASKKQFVEVKNGSLDFVASRSETNGHENLDSRASDLELPSAISESHKRDQSHLNVSQLHVFKKVKVNRVSNEQIANSNSNNSGVIKNTEYSNMPFNLSLPKSFENFSPQNETHREGSPFEQVYDMAIAAGCAEECHCGPDCSCPGCLVHRTNKELKEYGLLDSSPSSSVTPRSFLQGDEFSLADTIRNSNNRQFEIPISPNGNTEAVNDTTLSTSNEAIDPNFFSLENLINFRTIDELFNNDFLHDMGAGVCLCADDECSCYNCDQHNIKDGVKVLARNEL